MYKILIVEDDIKLRKELSKFLNNNGYETSEVVDFSNTVDLILKEVFDLILLDINLPNLNGEIICKELRKKIDSPIIMITSRDNEIDELLSINFGADDFITKPFNAQILLARIERLLKRANNIQESIKYKNLTLDIGKSTIYTTDDNVELSKNELKIFLCLINNKNKTVSRDDLMNYLWNTNEFVDDNTLTVNINRLRNNLSLLTHENIIVTRRGEGYTIL